MASCIAANSFWAADSPARYTVGMCDHSRIVRLVLAVLLSTLPACSSCRDTSKDPQPAGASAAVSVPALAGPYAQAGTELLSHCTWQYSADGGKTWATDPPAIKTGPVMVKGEFDVAEPGQFAGMRFSHGLRTDWPLSVAVNYHPLPKSDDGVFHRFVALPAGEFLVPGRNVITAEIEVYGFVVAGQTEGNYTLDLRFSLRGLRAGDLKLTTGPIISPDGDGFTVVCRTNMPAEVTLTAEPVDDSATMPATGAASRSASDADTLMAISYAGEVHRLTIQMPPGSRRFDCRLTGLVAGEKIDLTPAPVTGAPWIVSLIDENPRKLRIAAVGDANGYYGTWEIVAAAMLAQKPNLYVQLGDFTANGWDDYRWDYEYAVPAWRLLATTPMLPVIGNHEYQSPAYDYLMSWPTAGSLRHNWVWRGGDEVLIIGVDGEDDWAADGDCAAWLEDVLSASRERFVFLCTHFPPATSSYHGVLGLDGKPWETTVAASRDVILPLLQKYHATAILCGHEHCYERSEPPGGVTVITAGGGGGALRDKYLLAKIQNSYSKVYIKEHHFCVLDFDGDKCTLQAMTPEGKVLDTVKWKARTPATSPSR